MPTPRIITLTGLKHVGKSSVSQFVATHSNRRHEDTDEQIVERAARELPNTLSGTVTPRDVYSQLGSAAFAQLETGAVETLIQRAGLQRRETVLATGGGICDNPPAFELLQQRAHIVFLDAPFELLYARIAAGGVPAFLDAERPYDHFMELAARRRERYRAAAIIT